MKNKKLPRILIISLLSILLVGAAIFTVAASTSNPGVLYDGKTKEFTYKNAVPFLKNDKPDLFPNFKNIMPGDSITQKIDVGIKNVGSFSSVRISLSAENPNEDYKKLVETYGHWVKFTINNGEKEITGDLNDGVLLGKFKKNDSISLDVTLSLDIEAGNELQGLIAEVDWIFTAEVFTQPFPPFFPPRPDDPEEQTDLPWLTTEHVNYIIGYDDGLLYPEDTITRAEVVTIFYRLLTEEARDSIWSSKNKYSDVSEDSWYYIAICTLTNGGLIEGYPDGTFKPNKPISRAELATIITRFDTKFGKINITSGFEDAEGHWAENYVEFAATRNYVVGYPDGTFRPDKSITRAETVTMVNRCLNRCVDKDGLIEGYITWPDNLPDSWYYYEFIEAANYHSYSRSNRDVENRVHKAENWIKILEPLDWKTHEQEWLRIVLK